MYTVRPAFLYTLCAQQSLWPRFPLIWWCPQDEVPFSEEQHNIVYILHSVEFLC
jgi:hypothetical protein